MSEATANEEKKGPDQFEELPDAPPRQRLKLSLTGKISVGIVVFWIVLAIIGPWASPYTED